MSISILNSLISVPQSLETYTPPTGSVHRGLTLPDGYLPCNGDEININQYPDLGEAIADKNGGVIFHPPGIINGTPWINQNAFNLADQPDPFYMYLDCSDPLNNNAGNVVVYRNKVIVFGFVDGSETISNKLWSNTIDNDGHLGTWSYTTLPFALAESACVLAGNTIIVTGGFVDYNTKDAVNYICTCKISSDGTLGTWTVSPIFLPVPLKRHKAVVHGSTLFVMGGISSAFTDAIYSIGLDTNNLLTGTWTTVGHTLPKLYYGGHECAVVGDYIYIIGGECSDGYEPYIHRAKIVNNSIDAFEQYMDLKFYNSAYGEEIGVGNIRLVVTSFKMYGIFADSGFSGGRVFTIDIGFDGSLSSPLILSGAFAPSGICNAAVFITSSGLYAIGIDLNSSSTSQRWITLFYGGRNDYKYKDMSLGYNAVALPNCSTQDSADGLLTYIKI